MSNDVKLGRADFLFLCPGANKWTGTWDENDVRMGLRLGTDGIYAVPAPGGSCLFADEAAFFSQHPEKDLTKPVLSFPCSIRELNRFVEWTQLGELWTDERFEQVVKKWRSENVTPKDFADRLFADGKSKDEVAARLKGCYPELAIHVIGELIYPQKKSMKYNTNEKRGQRALNIVKADKTLSKLAGFS